MERKEIIDKAFNMEKNKRIPIFSNFWTWKILDSNYTLREALENYEIMEIAVSEFQERYQFDSLFDLGVRNPLRVTDALGGSEYHKVDDQNESIYVIDHEIMKQNEYKEVIEDKTKFYWTKAFARYCPELTISQLQNATREFLEFGKFSQRISKKFVDQYQCVPVPDYYLKNPYEYFFTSLRGMKGSAIDLRKVKSDLIDAVENIYQTITLPNINKALSNDNSSFMCDMYTAFLGHSILSAKQFEEIYWPTLKRAFDLFASNNRKLLIQSESTMLRFSEFFQDIPKGLLVIQLEQDDIFEIRKKLPNICLAGGMPTFLLGHGTPQECVDYAKRLLDVMGDGYIFSQDKMISFRNDCKRENLLVANDFVRNYKI